MSTDAFESLGSVPIAVARTGAANLASVRAAFARLGRETAPTSDPEAFALAPLAILPGVGAFGPAVETLRATGLDLAVRERVEARRPTLAVCLGFQLLLEGSDEAPGVQGLALVPGRARRYGAEVRVPQLGWNRVVPEAGRGEALVEEGWACFANSFRLDSGETALAREEGWRVALAEYGGTFVAACERGPVLACQFHPELSGAWGAALLRRWLGRADSAAAGARGTEPVGRRLRPATAEGTGPEGRRSAAGGAR